MNQTADSELLDQFRAAVAGDELDPDLMVVYRVPGGTPGTGLEEVQLTGAAQASGRLVGEGPSAHPREVTARLDGAQTRRLLQQVAESLQAMVPPSEAGFLPDSLVGSATITIGGRQATRFFLADEDQTYGQSERIAASAQPSARPLRELSEQMLRAGGEQR